VPRSRIPRRLPAAVLVTGLLIGCTAPATPALRIQDASAPPAPSGADVAVSLTIVNDGPTEGLLIGASSPVAAAVRPHEWTGARMRPVEAIPLPPSSRTVLEPDGYHLMLVGTQALQAGETIRVTLRFNHGAEREVRIRVMGTADESELEGDAETPPMARA
jgi:periplasmic copper chaperone A